MKRKIATFFLGGICIIYIVIVLISLTKHIYVLFAIMMCFLIICIISGWGLVQYRRYMFLRIIDPKMNLKRNYKYLYLGMQDGKETEENILDLRGYSRNYYVDSLLVQRYYSFLDHDGVIKIFSGMNSKYIKEEKISILDYPLLHPVTLMEHGIKPQKYIMYNPMIGLRFIWALIYRSKNKKEKLGSKIKSIEDFCTSRGIDIEIIEWRD